MVLRAKIYSVLQEKASKSFMSMFDSDEEDGPMYDSQLNTLPGTDYDFFSKPTAYLKLWNSFDSN